VLCVVGAGLGGADPLKPLGGFSSDVARAGKSEQVLEWQGVKSVADVQQAVRGSQKPVLLDVYADWCISCKVMEEQVFPTAAVAPLLDRFQLLKADVTRNDAIDQELLNHYGLFGPPSLVFFRQDSSEIEELRLQGEVSEQQLVPHLQAVLARNAEK
jgi:thiol:disulfide interchange protein DsbD